VLFSKQSDDSGLAVENPVSLAGKILCAWLRFVLLRVASTWVNRLHLSWRGQISGVSDVLTEKFLMPLDKFEFPQ
jgi:hypothetical protein